jgi:hypothetical protein
MKLVEPNGKLTTNYSKLGNRIEYIYPILDPALKTEDAII